MPRIHIVRHGNTFDKGDTVTRVGARTDLPLSTSGIDQASALADHFKDTSFTAAFCSPLQRTKQTARAILRARRVHPPLLIRPFLTEIDYGEDENKPEAEVVARLGEAAIEAWDRDAVPPPGWHVDPDYIIAGWRSLFYDVAELGAEDDVLIVTSNGIARFALDAADIAPHGIQRKLKTGAWGDIVIEADGTSTVHSWNEGP